MIKLNPTGKVLLCLDRPPRGDVVVIFKTRLVNFFIMFLMTDTASGQKRCFD